MSPDTVSALNQQPAYDVILPIDRKREFRKHRVEMELTPLTITFNSPWENFSIPIITSWACYF